MVRKLIEWAVNNPFVVILLAVGLAGFGVYAFLNVNVEAYPDPAPAIIEVVAQYPGASAEEMERLVTIPLEVTLAGMPGLTYTRSKSLAGLSHLRNQFEYGVDFYKARQEVINRFQAVQGLPVGVTPTISPVTPTGELIRYTLSNPRGLDGRELPIYALTDLKSLQDWTLVRQFRRVPRIIDVSSFGGETKRYEIHPDPDRLRRYGITLNQLQNAVANSNSNVGGDYLIQGQTALNVRGFGLIGGGLDPMQQVLGLEAKEMEEYLAAAPTISTADRARFLAAVTSGKVMPPLNETEQRQLRELRRIVGAKAAVKAAGILRAGDEARIRDIREIVVAAVNNVPVRVKDLVEGGPELSPGEALGTRGVVVGHPTRLGMVSVTRPLRDAQGNLVRDKDGKPIWANEEDKVQGIVLLRKGEESLPALNAVKARAEEDNDRSGVLLPGVQIEPHFDLTYLLHVTTETVQENLILGMVLVTVILLMFLSNVRSALIVAINIPLALLFAFSVLFLRGKSANLLSIGAVDFGIIVDSSVIMVENIYRHISAGEHAELPLKDRIARASQEVERGLFFSTAIMICAFIPLFTMQGPEGQIFGPMADTYAFALGGALLLALTLAPVLCLLFFKRLGPARDNFLVRWLKSRYLRQLERCLNYRWVTMGVFATLLGVTLVFMVPHLGREFMPELEEGNLYNRGTFPVNASLQEVASKCRTARELMRQYPEVELVATQVGRPDDGTDPTGFYNAEFHVPLKPQTDWPKRHRDVFELRLPRFLGGQVLWSYAYMRAVTKPELIKEMNDELVRKLPAVDWNFSQYIRDNVMESLSGVKGDNSIKIIGPDLDKLEALAKEVERRLEAVDENGERKIKGIVDVGIFRIKGQTNLDLRSDPKKCQFWGVPVGDVNNVIQTAVGGQAFTRLVEGEKTFDVTLRWPWRLRSDEHSILNIPVDITNNTVTGGVPSVPQTAVSGPSTGLDPRGMSIAMPSLYGGAFAGTVNNISSTPRRRLADLVTPLNDQGQPDPKGHFIRPGTSTIYREQGMRFIPVKFSVRGRDLASAVADAQRATADLFVPPYRADWSGEFEEMERAERRLLLIIPLSLVLIFVLLYLAFRSFLDVFVILSNVIALSMGGVWALLITGTNFSISAAVGFISIFGVAIMDGLLSVSYFNALRVAGLPLREAILRGAGMRVRPMMMTALTAIFGLLPAALSTRIGSQTQQPLAIVVVGGMAMTLLLNRYLMPVLYSFYGHREPSAAASRLAH
jgi:cobalt-zinc-cadmium resistance protein CzcA